MKIEELYCHPVKSMRGLSLRESKVTSMGLEFDRTYAVVDAQRGTTLTAREKPSLLGFTVALLPSGGLTLSVGDEAVTVNPGKAVPPNPHEKTPTAAACYSVWSNPITALDMGDECAEFISDHIGKAVRLVHSYAGAKRTNSILPVPDTFVDLMPVLITTVESLDALNSHLNTHWDYAVTQRHFRPNIVVSGVETPYSEDTWDVIKVGTIPIEITMGCSRCIMPEYDPDSQQKRKDLPVTQALKYHRREKDKKLYFGQNAVPKATGIVRVGDTVEILSRRQKQRLSQEGKDFYQL